MRNSAGLLERPGEAAFRRSLHARNNSGALSVMHIVPALFRADDGVIGGAERYALELARNMADVVPTTLVSFGKRSSEETFGSLKVKVLGHTHFVRGQR